jgi:hypothetical protein
MKKSDLAPIRAVMISDENKSVRPLPAEPETSALGGGGRPEETGAEVELALADLVADANGEIVFFNDSGFGSLAIRTDRTVIADGRTGAHATAAGDDVSGFQFVRFDNGLTLYFEPGLHLILLGPASSPA